VRSGARAGLFEAGEVRVNPTGSVTVFTGSHSPRPGSRDDVRAGGRGQARHPDRERRDRARRHRPRAVRHGHLRQPLAVRRRHGDRQSRRQGDRQGKKIAAHLLEASDTDIEFENGVFKVAGTDKSVPFGSVSLTAYVPHNYPLDKLEPGLNENAF